MAKPGLDTVCPTVVPLAVHSVLGCDIIIHRLSMIPYIVPGSRIDYPFTITAPLRLYVCTGLSMYCSNILALQLLGFLQVHLHSLTYLGPRIILVTISIPMLYSKINELHAYKCHTLCIVIHAVYL